MALNKIIYKDRTLIDLTNTTAVESDVFTGKIFHKADGTTAVGTGGGSLKLCVKHFSGQYTPPASSYQIDVGGVGLVIDNST